MTVRRITYVRSMLLAGALLVLGTWNASHPAAAQAHDPRCVQVGGGIVTNFLDNTETLGTATGDLSGGLGVSVLGVTPGSGGGPRSIMFTITGSLRAATRSCSRTPT